MNLTFTVQIYFSEYRYRRTKMGTP